jgi:hypothetical protein
MTPLLALRQQFVFQICRSYVETALRIYETYLFLLNCLTLEDTLSRNVGDQLPINAASRPRRAQTSFKPQWKPGITHLYLKMTIHELRILVYKNYIIIISAITTSLGVHVNVAGSIPVPGRAKRTKASLEHSQVPSSYLLPNKNVPREMPLNTMHSPLSRLVAMFWPPQRSLIPGGLASIRP